MSAAQPMTVQVEEIHVGDEVSFGGPRKPVTWKIERDEKVELGFGGYLSGDRVSFDRGTLIDILIPVSGDYKAYVVFDGEEPKVCVVVPEDEVVGVVWE